MSKSECCEKFLKKKKVCKDCPLSKKERKLRKKAKRKGHA